MLKLTALRAQAAILFGCLGIAMCAGQAGASTTAPSRAPVCTTVENSYIIIFLEKIAAWQFTNHCNYAETFYVELPDTNSWSAWSFAPGESMLRPSAGLAAKLVHILECPKGYGAAGANPNICYKEPAASKLRQ